MKRFTALELDETAYKEIREIAKSLGIQGNKKKSVLIELIIEAQAHEESSATEELNVHERAVDAVSISDQGTSSATSPSSEPETIASGTTYVPSPQIECNHLDSSPAELKALEEKDIEHFTRNRSLCIESDSSVLTTPDFNIKKPYVVQSVQKNDPWIGYVTSPVNCNETVVLHDVTRKSESICTNLSESLDTLVHAIETPVFKGKNTPVNPERETTDKNNESPSLIIETNIIEENDSGTELQKDIGTRGTHFRFASPDARTAEKYKVHWRYEDYSDTEDEITTPQRLEMMRDNISTPQFLESKRKEKAAKERNEMLAQFHSTAKQVSETSQEIFGGLMHASTDTAESMLPSSVHEDDNKENSVQSSASTSCNKTLSNIFETLSDMSSKMTLAGLPTPQGIKTIFYSPEISKSPNPINWSSTCKAYPSESNLSTQAERNVDNAYNC